MILKENERIDDLQYNGLKLIQDKNAFCFGIDAVLLANFSIVKPNEICLEFGSGNGIVSVLLTEKTKGKFFYGIDIQQNAIELSTKNIELNNLSDKLKFIYSDLKKANELNLNPNVIVTNPPYMRKDSGETNCNEELSIARHEVKCDVEDIIYSASKCLGTKGRFYMIHRSIRITDILYFMRKYKLEAKRVRFVHSFVGKESNMVLIEAIKDAKYDCIVEKPLILYESDNMHTEEVLKMYGRL